MFIFLSKLLPLFVYPVGLVCILIILALWGARGDAKKNARQRLLLATTLLVLFVGGNRWVARGLARSLEWRYLPPQELPTGEVIVLLGGGTQSADYPRPMVEVNGAGDRVLYAAWLYQQGAAPHILLAGGTLDWVHPDLSPAEQMAVLLEMMGVPEDALWLESHSRNTYENAVYCAEILEAKGIRRILLVTSASHMPRSVLLFEAQGLDVVPLPVDFTATQAPGETLNLETITLSLIPSAANLALTTRMLKEYLGIFVYNMRGWL